MSIKQYARIEFLVSTYGNDKGDVVKVQDETEGEIYYYDGFRRYCYLYKEADKEDFRYIPKGQRLNGKT